MIRPSPATGPGDDSTRSRHALGAAAIVLATLLAYLPVIIDGGFIWDDDSYLTKNPVLQADDALAQIWTPGNTPQYYPIVFTAFWIEFHIWGLSPHGYHTVNVLLHAINALLVWRIMGRLGVRGAWLIASLFALHPVNVESVAWITERKNVLSGLFYLTAGLAYLRFESGWHGQAPLAHAFRNRATNPWANKFAHATRAAWAWYAAGLGLFVLALLSKTVTCSLPAALILAMLYLREPLTLRRLVPLVPWFIVALALAMQTVSLERTRVGAVGPDFDLTFIERCLVASRALLFYPYKLLIPWPLIFIYPRWTIDAGSPAAYWPIVAVAAVAMAALLAYRRGWRGAPLALAFYAGTVFPALGFFNVYPHLFSFVADHFVYLASLGLMALAGGAFARFAGRTRQTLWALPVLVVLATLTFTRGYAYASESTLHRDTIAKNPAAWMAHTNLASILLKQADAASVAGDDEAMRSLATAARRHAEAAIAVRPRHHTAEANLSEALRLLGEDQDAIDHMRIALEERPHWAQYHYLLGRLYQKIGRFDEAIAAYESAIERMRPSDNAYAIVQLELGTLLYQLDDPARAEPHLTEVLAVHPGDFTALSLLGDLAQAAGDHRSAADRFQQAMTNARTLDENLKAGYRLAWILATSPDDSVRNGGGQVAEELANGLVKATSGTSPHMLLALAAAQAESGRYEQAVATAERAVEAARSMGRDDLAHTVNRHLERYRAGQPWRETGVAPQ